MRAHHITIEHALLSGVPHKAIEGGERARGQDFEVTHGPGG
jgi:hypothetical protein